MQVFYKDYDLLKEFNYTPERWSRVDPGTWHKNII
jgi:hypothetical protein